MSINSFRRQVSKALIEGIKGDRLFTECLLPDILSKKPKARVFPAIRNGRIDFYHAGGKLFSYRQGAGFSTHAKYAAVLTGVDRDYLTEKQLKQACLIKDFNSGYESIKANCARYAGVEAAGVAGLCGRSWFTDSDQDVVALDIEVSFSGDSAWDGKERSTGAKAKKYQVERPDLLLYDKRDGTLRFYEAKHFSNSELWAPQGTKPTVEKQLTRYNLVLRRPENQKVILEAYARYTECVHGLFGLDLDAPSRIEPSAVLYVFGYDSKQAKKITELLIDDGSLSGHRLRCRGNTGDAGHTAAGLWQRVVDCE